MGIYTERVNSFPLNQILLNLKKLEKGLDYAKENGSFNGDAPEIIQNKLAVNNRALDAVCDRAAEEIEQLKREGKWDCDEQLSEGHKKR